MLDCATTDAVALNVDGTLPFPLLADEAIAVDDVGYPSPSVLLSRKNGGSNYNSLEVAKCLVI